MLASNTNGLESIVSVKSSENNNLCLVDSGPVQWSSSFASHMYRLCSVLRSRGELDQASITMGVNEGVPFRCQEVLTSSQCQTDEALGVLK